MTSFDSEGIPSCPDLNKAEQGFSATEGITDQRSNNISLRRSLEKIWTQKTAGLSPSSTVWSGRTDSTLYDFSPKNDPQSLDPLQRRLIKAIFELDDVEVRSWPGAQLYLQYLDQQLKIVGPHTFWHILSAIGFSPPAYVDTLEFLFSVTEVLKRRPSADFSLNGILDSTLDRYGTPEITDAARISGQQAVFTIIGWCTMLFKPAPETSSNQGLRLEVPVGQSGLKSSQSINQAKRPITSLLRSLGNILPLEVEGHPREQIYVDKVNCFALKRIARVNIEWVDTLSAHLDFDEQTRTLLLFRFPTFCALNCLGDKMNHCFDRILQDYYERHSPNTSSNPADLLDGYKREVLLSYRVLFGQRKCSRKLFTSYERASAAGTDGAGDVFLLCLCGQPASNLRSLTSGGRPINIWPKSCVDYTGHLREQDVYSPQGDFPLLGARLLSLQAFSMRQSPSRLRDLWRDRRDPMIWYSVWVLIFLTGLTLILTLVQVLLSIAQLGVSIKSMWLQSPINP